MTLKAHFPYFGGKARIAPTVWRALGKVWNDGLAGKRKTE